MRKTQFFNGEYYHIYNRGVEKRDIFLYQNDTKRFMEALTEFNVNHPIGSIHENKFRKSVGIFEDSHGAGQRLVDIVAFALIPNHFHFILRQRIDGGISNFMQKLGTGYTMYFNGKYDRSGRLFQGTFKSIHVNSDTYLIYLSSYVNLNHEVHQLGGLASKLAITSIDEYAGRAEGICSKDFIMSHFESPQAYVSSAFRDLKSIMSNRGIILPEGFYLEA